MLRHITRQPAMGKECLTRLMPKEKAVLRRRELYNCCFLRHRSLPEAVLGRAGLLPRVCILCRTLIHRTDRSVCCAQAKAMFEQSHYSASISARVRTG